jgi:prephenate dehydrogenase
MELLIVGAGAMGRWFARTVNSNIISITFADIDDETASEAAAELDADAISLDADQQFDIVCFAVPMSVIEESIAAHAHNARRAVLDVTGTMAGPVETMAEHGPGLERASLHPLFSPENAPGNVAVVEDAPGPAIDTLLGRVSDAGNVLAETTAAEHDELMETVQAKAHVAILAFALASEDVPEGYSTPVCEGLVNLVGQVTGNSPHVYAEIQDTFDGAREVAEAARRIADADGDEFERLYREAGDRR